MRAASNETLFGLAPGGVYRAANCCQLRGALLPHPFTLTCALALNSHRRFVLCCTSRRLSPPRRYLAPCPMEPGLSSPLLLITYGNRQQSSGCLANSNTQL